MGNFGITEGRIVLDSREKCYSNMRPKGLQITRDTETFNSGKHACRRTENDMRIENRELNCKNAHI